MNTPTITPANEIGVNVDGLRAFIAAAAARGETALAGDLAAHHNIVVDGTDSRNGHIILTGIETGLHILRDRDTGIARLIEYSDHYANGNWTNANSRYEQIASVEQSRRDHDSPLVLDLDRMLTAADRALTVATSGDDFDEFTARDAADELLHRAIEDAYEEDFEIWVELGLAPDGA